MALTPPKQIRQFVEAVQDIVGQMLVGAGIVSVVYDDTGNIATINATGGGAGNSNIDGGNASSIAATNIDGGTAAG